MDVSKLSDEKNIENISQEEQLLSNIIKSITIIPVIKEQIRT